MTWVDPEKLFNATVGIPSHRDDLQKMPEVIVKTWRYVVCVERESQYCKLLGLTHCNGADPHNRLSSYCAMSLDLGYNFLVE